MTTGLYDRSPLKLAAVINWPDLGGWIWDHLPEKERDHDTHLIFASQDHDVYITGRRRLPPYLSEIYHLGRRRLRWDDYDVVFAWELRTAIAVALLRKLTGQKRAKFVSLQPILKGPVLESPATGAVGAVGCGSYRQLLDRRSVTTMPNFSACRSETIHVPADDVD